MLDEAGEQKGYGWIQPVAGKTAEDQGKGWWSQRDSNPCLSLERADDDEEDQ